MVSVHTVVCVAGGGGVGCTSVLVIAASSWSRDVAWSPGPHMVLYILKYCELLNHNLSSEETEQRCDVCKYVESCSEKGTTYSVY